MEGLEKQETAARKGLKRLLVYYCVAALVLVLTISGTLILNAYCDFLYDSVNRLLAIKVGYVKMKDATEEIRRSAEKVKAIIPPGVLEESPDRLIVASLDTVKARFRNDEVVIAGIAHKDTEVSLPVTIKGRLNDYSGFVNDIGFLQAMKFPFFSVMNVALKKTEESGTESVVYEITGELRFPKLQGGAQATGTKGGTL
jgi:hypothetical protein